MPVPADSASRLPEALERAFAPLHKRAFGLAIGLTVGAMVWLVTAFHVIVRPDPGPPLYLLAQYFYGYSVTWVGAFVGLWWGFVAGFAAGWFIAFLRNVVLATWIFKARTTAELSQTSDFLDHI